MINLIKNIRYFIFIPIFLILYLLLINFSNGILTNLDKLDLVSIATFENYSVAKLINTTYEIIFGSFFALLILSIVFAKLHQKSAYFRDICKFQNIFSAIGILLIFFTYTITETIDVVHFFCLINIAAIFYFFIFNKKKEENNLFKGSPFWLLLFLTICLIIASKDFLFIFHTNQFPVLYIFLPIFIICLFAYKFLNKYFSTEKLFYYSIPIFSLPLLSVIKTEIFLIFNQRNISLHSPQLIWLIGILLILLAIFLLFILKKKFPKPSKTLYNIIVPLFLIGIISWINYTPFFEINSEFFENANPANAIFRSFSYHEIPFVDFLCSHAMSEIFFGYFYVFLNGYSSTADFFIYNFIFQVVWMIILYYFLLKTLGKTPIIFFICFLSPFLILIFSRSLILSLIILMVWYNFFKKPNFINLLIIIFCTILSIFWKFDLGLPCLFILIIFSVTWLILNFSKKTILLYIKAFGIVALFFGILSTIFIIIDYQHFISSFLQAKDYLISNQAHALTEITCNDDKTNFYNHILYPIIIILMLFGLFHYFFTKKINSQNSFLWFSILFLILVYIFNFQRGLVRHSLYEQHDSGTTAYIYLTITLFLLLYLPKSLKTYKNYIFCFSISILPFIFSFPFPKEDKDLCCNFLEKYSNQEENLRYILPKTCRVKNQIEYEKENFHDLKNFFDSNFDKDATFIDFSNTPMLYFNLQRQVPSYFCQYMQNTVSPFLQEENIKNFKKYDIPVVIFSNEPNNWFDNTDGVPNTLRYNIICKYIYQNYEPLTIMNKHSVWIRKNLQDNFKDFEKDTISAYDNKFYYLKKYPYLLGKYDKKQYENIYTISVDDSEKKEIPQNVDFQNSPLIIKVIKSEKTTNARLLSYKNHIGRNVIEFEIQQSKTEINYIIPINANYSWYSGNVDAVAIETYIPLNDNNISISFILK
ncbi:MAG: hypothetical protein LBV69_03900 [Bacteroidales bacterium]|jgi:hypothetical protein|nr:hypothetical protein [Bacteroidales bacterium]